MWTRTTIALAAACCVACNGGGIIDAPTTTDLVVVAGGSATDTAGSRLAQALVVEVRRDGRPQPGVVVTFSGTLAAEPNPAQRRTAWVSDVAYNSFEANAQVTTNSAGRAAAVVQLGEFAGAAAIVVRCPAMNLADTVDYIVLPSSAARLVMTVDTAVLAGVTYPLDAYVTDRHGNRRDDVVTYAAGTNVVSVDVTGRVTVPRSVVRGAVAVRSGAFQDSARFTVVLMARLLPRFHDVGRRRGWVIRRSHGRTREDWEGATPHFKSRNEV